MAAAVARGGVAALRRSSLLTSCNFLIHENLCVRPGVLWKQPPSRTFFSDRKKLHTAPVGQVFRLRPFHVLVATGGGYAGYRKYEDYKLEQLEKRGIEVPVKLASEWEGAGALREGSRFGAPVAGRRGGGGPPAPHRFLKARTGRHRRRAASGSAGRLRDRRCPLPGRVVPRPPREAGEHRVSASDREGGGHARRLALLARISCNPRSRDSSGKQRGNPETNQRGIRICDAVSSLWCRSKQRKER
ncbi:phosphatidylserine decarboxylase proenzyme, mitochondrial [Grus japonensis]|uniref:Phosphatidylserine decarboxylase proenzyme, mitochondrial n=1 Tax=Grus japonensis TaxID=30415 RepID=A0ABC9XID8_GRUJA